VTRLDEDGQPENRFFNRERSLDRDISELLGLAKGLLADGDISPSEVGMVANWVSEHPDTVAEWPVSILFDRLERIFADGRIDNPEREDLAELLSSLVGGTTGTVLGQDGSSTLPLDAPPPAIRWDGAVFVVTGRLAFGPRALCKKQIEKLGGLCHDRITLKTNYLIVGTFASRDWIQGSYGRKIEEAVELRKQGHAIAIIGEDHWAASLMAAAEDCP
jgi:hypothetical protein